MASGAAPDGMERYTAIRIWRSMDPDRRLKAAAAIWEPGMAKPEEVVATLMAIASARRFRVQSIREAPKAKRAGYLASLNVLPDGVASAVLYAYHMAHQVPMMSRFLDALEIEHEGGKITGDLDPPGAEKLASAADALLAEFDRNDVSIYLRTLVHQDPDAWGGLAEVVEARELG